MAKSHGWEEVDMPPGPISGESLKAFKKGACRVIRANEDHNGLMRFHLSISCSNRYPTWEEIKDARYCLLPLGLTFAMILPPPNEYVNIHPNCFHLWEIDNKEW